MSTDAAARWVPANSVDDFGELRVGAPLLYCEEPEMIFFEARVDFVAWDYCVIRYTVKEDEMIVVVTDLSTVHFNLPIYIEDGERL